MRAAARCAALLVSGVVMTVAAEAAAEPAARFVYLRGKDTESCPSDSDVRGAVQRRLGYDPFSTYAASTMFAEVSALPSSGGYVANLKLVDADNTVKGDRTLRVNGRCAELMEAMALTISIAIDPMSVTRNGPPPDAPPAEKPVDPTLSPADPEPSTEAADPPEQRIVVAPPPPGLALFAALGPVASVGAAPSLALGGAVGIDGQLGRLVFGVEGRGDLPASAKAGELGTVQSSLLSGLVFLGAREGPLSAGGVFALGQVTATSRDVATSNNQSALFLAAGFRVGAAVRLTDRLEARARVEVLGNLERHTLTISAQHAYQYPVASADLGLGLAVRFK